MIQTTWCKEGCAGFCARLRKQIQSEPYSICGESEGTHPDWWSAHTIRVLVLPASSLSAIAWIIGFQRARRCLTVSARLCPCPLRPARALFPDSAAKISTHHRGFGYERAEWGHACADRADRQSPGGCA